MVYVLKKLKGGKLTPEYIGPAEIIELHQASHTVTIEKGKDRRIVNLNQIKRGHELPRPPAPNIITTASL